MIKRTLIVGLLGLLLIPGAKAQDAAVKSDTTMYLSLAQAQEYAREHNATMANANLDVKKAEMAKWETLSTMLPQVTASYNYQNMCGYEMVFGTGMATMKIPMDPTGTLGVQASIALTGQQIVGTVMNKLAVQMQETNRAMNEQSINSNVKNAYVSILIMEQTVGLLDSSLANMERLAAQTQAAVTAGAAEQTDADKLAVQVASIRSSINSTRLSLAMLYNSMILQLGAGVNDKIILTTKLDEILSVDNAMQLLAQNFNIENNYTYQLLQQNEKLAKDQVALAWSSFAPTVSVFYQYSKKHYFGDKGMDMTPPNMVGASVSLPLWQTGTRAFKIGQAKIALEENRNSKKQAEDGLKVQYKQLCNNLVTALETYQIQNANIEVSTRVFNKISEKYKYGQSSSLEVTQSSSDLINAQSSYIQSVMNVISAQVALEDLMNNNNSTSNE